MLQTLIIAVHHLNMLCFHCKTTNPVFNNSKTILATKYNWLPNPGVIKSQSNLCKKVSYLDCFSVVMQH